jgi:PAS domain S-box-containing protein
MADFFRRLFASDFMPHGQCFFWRPELVWLHVISDALIAGAYYSIPLALYYIMRRRRSRFRYVILMFAGFILACGSTHLMAIWNLWHSAYRLEGVIKAITGILSIATAIVTIRVTPVVLRMPATEDLQRANESLRSEIDARLEVEKRLQRLMRSELASDLTERKRVADELHRTNVELRASEAQLRSFLEAASQGILAISEDGLIVLVNRRMEELFGYSRDELIGQDLEMLLPDRFRAGHASYRSGYFRGPRMRPMGPGMPLFGLRKDGAEFPVEIGLSFVETDHGLLAMGLVSDVTERKQAADQLARAMEDLRRSNAELEQFASVASHDLQEPLRMVTGYLNILQRRYGGRLDADAQEFIRYAVEGAARMKGMIQEILSLSRVGTQAVHCLPSDGAEIVQRALENLGAAIKEGSAEIHVHPLPSIVADPGLLALVFQNLIGNAVKFRGPNPPRVVVSAQRQDQEWIFSVKDNGIGIKSEHINRIFGIFERLHVSGEYPGAGVGLAIAKKIVERHGGRIWAESTPGQGSTFCFSLPVRSGSI